MRDAIAGIVRDGDVVAIEGFTHLISFAAGHEIIRQNKRNYVDFVVGNQVVLELKSVDEVAPIHHQQILSYMRVARLRAGLLVNFNVAILPDGLTRKIL